MMQCPVLKDAELMKGEGEAMEALDYKDIIAHYLLSQRLLDLTLLQLSTCPTSRAHWEHLAKKYSVKESQQEQEKKQEVKELTKCESGRTQRRGRCHSCKGESHQAHECCTLKEGTVTVAQMTSGATVQPESLPMDAAHDISIIDLEGGSFWMVEEEATHMHNGSAKLGLPQGHGEVSSPQVHAQIVAVEQDPFLGEEDTLDVVTHTQAVVVEPDAILDEGDALEEVAHAQLV